MTTDGPDGPEGPWPVYAEPATDEIRREPPPAAPAGPPPAGSRRRVLTVVVGVAAALAAVGVAGFLLADGDDVLPEKAYEPIMDAATLDEVARLLERETGSTQLLKFGAYGTDEITLVVPPAAPDDLAVVYRWDGMTLEKWMAEQPGDAEPFDLRDIDADVLVDLDLAGREESGEPVHDSRVSIERPVLDHESWIYLNVRETDDDTLALWADLDGNIESTLESE